MNFSSLPRFFMVYKHNKNNENVIGCIVWAGPNGQNELLLPIENTCKHKKGTGQDLNIEK